MKTYGLILAGGLGTRLGHVRKGDLRVGGQRLISRAEARMSHKVDELYIASGNHRTEEILATTIPDLAPNEGPMGAIRAFLHFSEADSDSICVTATADSPFLPVDYVDALTKRVIDTQKPVVSWWGGQIYPTHAAWPVSLLAEMAHYDSPRKALTAAEALALHWAEEKPNPFENINTIGDLIRVQKRAEGLGKSQTIHRLCE